MRPKLQSAMHNTATRPLPLVRMQRWRKVTVHAAQKQTFKVRALLVWTPSYKCRVEVTVFPRCWPQADVGATVLITGLTPPSPHTNIYIAPKSFDDMIQAMRYSKCMDVCMHGPHCIAQNMNHSQCPPRVEL